MKISKVIIVVIAAILALGGFGIALRYFTCNRAGISQECFEKIKEGMTHHQVEAILGGPPRWEVETVEPMNEVLYHFRSRPWEAEWWGREGVITVGYTGYKEGIVKWKQYKRLPFEPKPASLWETVFLL